MGEDGYQKIKNNMIICCGTVLGSRAEMIIFIDHMIEMLKRSTAWGDEQAAMNHLVYNKILPIKNIIKSDVITGELFTAGLVRDFKITDTKILRGDGGVPAIVHQYGNKDAMNKIVDNFYREKNFRPNFDLIDFRSAFDQVFCLTQVKNWRMATMFFINYVFFEKILDAYAIKLLRLLEMILKNYSSNAEILFLSIQKALSTNPLNLGIYQMEDLYEIFINADKGLHAVNFSFKKVVFDTLKSFVEYFYSRGMNREGLIYIERLENLQSEDFPIKHNIYIMKAEFYRAMGQKAEALKAYEKALDLS